MDIQQMINDYADWLKKEITAAKVGEYYELTTPYLDRYNDYLQIYVKQEPNGKLLLTDDGNILGNLSSSGASISRSPKRKEMLSKILRNFGIELCGEDLIVTATARNFPEKKHMLIQAMLTIDDMFIAEPNNIKNFFAEDIGSYLDANDIFYSRDFSLVGKTGSIYYYDYHIQRTRQKPERFCKAINRINESNRNLTLFNWMDTKERRSDAANMIVFINDNNPVDDIDLEAFTTYDVDYILWSERNKEHNIQKLIG